MKSMSDWEEKITNLNKIHIETTVKKISKVNTEKTLNLPMIKSPSEAQRKQKMNFKSINDNYRKQLNRAFLNFNPAIHWANLNLLRKADPAINEEIIKLTKNIEDDIQEITDKKYYRKQYEKLKAENQKERDKLKILKQKERKMQTEQTIATAETEGRRCNVRWKQSYRAKKGVIMSFDLGKRKGILQPIDNKLKAQSREQRDEEWDLMSSAILKIKGSVSKETIGNYIDSAGEHKDWLPCEQKHKYFSEWERAETIIKQIKQNQLTQRWNEETVKQKLIVANENKRLLEEIVKSKEILLHDVQREEAK